MSDKVTVDISPIANSITVAPVTTSVEISQNNTTVELKNVTYENNITQTVTNVDITPTTTTVEATVNTTTVDISPNTDASIVASNLASATNITHDSNSWITGGNVQASFDNLATTADSRYVNVTGDTMTGNLNFGAGIKATFGNSTDLQMYHDGSHSYIRDAGEGNLRVDADHFYVRNLAGTQLKIGAITDGATSLYHAGSKKLETTADGVDITGEATATVQMEAPLFKGDLEGAIHFKASGSNLAKGDVVYISGYQGQRTTVDKADASDSAKMPAFGIVNAVQGGNVDVLTFGSMLHLSTTGIATGTELYVSATTPGGYETSAPTGEGNLVQKIAKVVRGDSNSGSIKIMGAGRTNATPNLNDGNIFIGNSSNIPTTVSFDTTFGSSLATRSTSDLSEGTNLYYTTARFDTAFGGKSTSDLSEGTNLYYTDARADARISAASIGDLSDVDITTNTPTNDQVLVWSTDKFVPADQSGAGGVDLTAFSVGSPATASGTGAIGYNNTSGVFTYTPPNLSSYLTSETTTSLALESNVLKYTDETGTENEIDISLYLDDTNLARLTAGTLDSSNGTATFTRSDNTTFTVDFSSLINSAEVNDLSTSVTWANVPNANITEGSVTQHQTALSITESQISDLGSYITDYTVTESDVTAHQAALSVTESQISDLGSYLTSETSHTDVLVDGDFTSNGLMKRTGDGQYAIDSSTYITDYTVTEGDVTAHQAALSVTESQISDLGTYLTNIEGQDLKDLADVTYSGTPRNHSLLVYNPLVTGGGTNADKWTVGTNVAIDSIESDLSPNSTPATYQVYKTLVDDSGDTDLAYLTIGGAPSGSYGNTNNLFDRVELRAGSDGIRMHWYENSESVAGQTERFHTTNRGIHVGDDRTGTYTAGDLQQNADLDYGMLVGRESINTGSNNFGFGYKHSFGTGTASNFGTGSLHQCNVSGSENNVFAGGDNRLTTSGDFNFCGGVRTSTRNTLNFSWGEGVVDGINRYPAKNYGYNCVLFGKQTEIDGNSQYSLVGGDVHPTNYNHTFISHGKRVINWGLANELTHAIDSITVGNQNDIDRVSNSAIFGASSNIGDSNSVSVTGLLVGGNSHNITSEASSSLVVGVNHTVEGNANFASGQGNNTLGDSAACIGKGLKTPLFEPNAGGDYVWDDYSVTVGGYNDEAHKYYTNTNSTAWVEDHRFVVGTGTASNAKDNGFIVAVPDSGFCGIIMPNLASSPSYSNDLNAKAGGVPVGGLYHTDGVVKIVQDS